MITPHDCFKYIRADEVAECWGVPKELYYKLWNTIVPSQKPIPNIEDNGPADVLGYENLASHWDKLTEDEQNILNEVAEREEGSWDI